MKHDAREACRCSNSDNQIGSCSLSYGILYGIRDGRSSRKVCGRRKSHLPGRGIDAPLITV